MPKPTNKPYNVATAISDIVREPYESLREARSKVLFEYVEGLKKEIAELRVKKSLN